MHSRVSRRSRSYVSIAQGDCSPHGSGRSPANRDHPVSSFALKADECADAARGAAAAKDALQGSLTGTGPRDAAVAERDVRATVDATARYNLAVERARRAETIQTHTVRNFAELVGKLVPLGVTAVSGVVVHSQPTDLLSKLFNVLLG
jgi:hypothetical protein